MNIAIDISALSNQHKDRGIGSYTELLMSSLKQDKSGNRYSYFNGKLSEHWGLDIVHYPYFHFFTSNLLCSPKIRRIITIHDMIPFEYPDKFPIGFRGSYHWLFNKRKLKGINAIITDSKYSKQSIIRFTGISSDHIHTVYLYANKIYQELANKNSLFNTISEKYALRKPYFIYVGDVNWNKNITSLITAFANIIKHTKKRISLVLVGKAFTNLNLPESKDIETLINKNSISSRIVKTGFVSANELSILYNNALAYIQPSLSEGFGLPVLEAMQCGTPVLVSNQGSIPEIVEKSGIYFNPQSVLDISEKIAHFLLLPETEKSKWSTKALNRARAFSSSTFLHDTLNIYKQTT